MEIYYPFLREIIAVITNPIPMPDKVHAIIIGGELCKKANPTRTPSLVIPPTAQALLSSFFVFQDATYIY
ncbi:hypothetical protein BFP75_09275 [Maribacter sp. 4G9]|nr:hypothetical protein BFP75_09275 [Maribacter sp. 4G9]